MGYETFQNSNEPKDEEVSHVEAIQSKCVPSPTCYVSTQTDISWPLLSNCAPNSHDHNYAFELNNSPNNITEYILTMEERLQVQTEMIDNLQKKVGNLQQELEEYKDQLYIEVPSSMLAQSQTWSNYKHHNTFKVLVGTSPNGQVTFVSKLWGGRVSDKEITQQSGVMHLLKCGDNVMADRGFDIGGILPPGCHLNIPPFKGTRDQLTADEVQETARIASVRIHVERAIGRIKNYHILDGTLPLSLAHIADQIFFVCAYLTNFLTPLLEPKMCS